MSKKLYKEIDLLEKQIETVLARKNGTMNKLQKYYLDGGEDSLWLFWREVYTFGRNPNYVNDEAHKEWARRVQAVIVHNQQNEQDIIDILMLEPRASMKSNFWQATAVWFILRSYIILKVDVCNVFYIRKTADMSSRWLSAIETNLEQNRTFQEIFGDINTLKGSPWNTKQCNFTYRKVQSIMPDIIALGTKTAITGGRAERGLVICDDIADRSDTESPAERLKTQRAYESLLPIAFNSPIIQVGTRWGENELYGDILRYIAEGTYNRKIELIIGTPLKVNIEVTDIVDLPSPDEDVWRFPDTCNYAKLKQMRSGDDGNRKIWLAWNFNKIIDDSSRAFPEIHCYLSAPTENMKYYFGVDFAFGTKKSDDTAVVVLGFHTISRTMYLVEVYAKQSTQGILARDIAPMIRKYNPRAITIEENSIKDKSTQNVFVDNICKYDKSFTSQQLWQRIYLKHNSKNKVSRILELDYDVQEGKILFPELNRLDDSNKELHEQLKTFTFRGTEKKDDILDALQMAWKSCKDDNFL